MTTPGCSSTSCVTSRPLSGIDPSLLFGDDIGNGAGGRFDERRGAFDQ